MAKFYRDVVGTTASTLYVFLLIVRGDHFGWTSFGRLNWLHHFISKSHTSPHNALLLLGKLLSVEFRVDSGLQALR